MWLKPGKESKRMNKNGWFKTLGFIGLLVVFSVVSFCFGLKKGEGLPDELKKTIVSITDAVAGAARETRAGRDALADGIVRLDECAGIITELGSENNRLTESHNRIKSALTSGTGIIGDGITEAENITRAFDELIRTVNDIEAALFAE